MMAANTTSAMMARFRLPRLPVIIASHSRQARRISCRANQASAAVEFMRLPPARRPVR
jgi:hypothetical protein